MNDTASKKRFVRPLAIAVALVVLAAAAWGAWKWWSGNGKPTESYVFAPVQRADIEDLVSATGSLQPLNYVDVGAQVSGQLTKILVEVGDEVKEGQLLAEIDAEQQAAKVDANRASVRAQQATLAQRQTELEKAERDLQRQKNLMAEEATTAETLQNAETDVRTARAAINTLKAQIEQAQASMRVDEANLKFTKIYAPMAGTVVSVSAKQGQTLNTNQSAPTILRIADQTTMTVQTQVGEADVSRLKVGMNAYFTTLGSQSRRWYGTLKKVEPTPTVTNNVVLYNALFDVPNTNRSLLTQMTAQVFFVVAEARGVLTVPVAALTYAPRAPAGGASGASSVAVAASGMRRVDFGPEAASGAASGPRGPGGSGSGPGGMSREAWQQLPEAERERLRAQRRAQMGGGAAASSGPRRATVKVQAEDGSIQPREVTVGTSNRVQAEILSGLAEGEKVVVGTKQADAKPAAGGQQQRSALSGGIGGMPPGMGGPR